MPQIQITSPDGETHTIELQATYIMIGRGLNCEVRLVERAISTHHAKIDLSGAEPCLIDLGSTNGTLVNQKQLEPNGRVILQDQDTITIGTHQLLFLQKREVQREPEKLADILAQEAQFEDKRPFLFVLNGPQAGTKVFFQEPDRQIAIGRGEDCELALVDAGASRRHATVRYSMGGAIVSDLGSRHGTSIDQTPLAPNQTMPIKDQQELRIGQTRIRFSDPEEALFASLAAQQSSTRSEQTTASAANPPTKKEERATPAEAPATGTNLARAWEQREVVLLALGVLCWVVALGLGWEALG